MFPTKALFSPMMGISAMMLQMQQNYLNLFHEILATEKKTVMKTVCFTELIPWQKDTKTDSMKILD